MMKGKHITTIITLIITTLLLVAVPACKKSGGNENSVLISQNTGMTSHKQGENCMSCHRGGGSGDGIFTVAGTVYTRNGSDINPNGTVQLYTEARAGGTQVTTVEVDGMGNFYTTEAVDFGTGLYTLVTSASGNVEHMNGPITSGACNSCHEANLRIWVD